MPVIDRGAGLFQSSAGTRILEITMHETRRARRQQQKQQRQRTEKAWQMNSGSARTATSLEEN
jgi:hypothetical protein